ASIKAAGIEPVGVNLSSPGWKEAFLHPRDAHGIVIQVAQQASSPPPAAPPLDLPDPGPASRLDLIEHHVGFARAAGTFSAADRERAGQLAERLGVRVELDG